MLLLSFILKKSVVSLKRRSRDYHVGQKLRRESSDVLRVRKFWASTTCYKNYQNFTVFMTNISGLLFRGIR
jgi:hypothetical protein